MSECEDFYFEAQSKSTCIYLRQTEEKESQFEWAPNLSVWGCQNKVVVFKN